MQGTRTFIVALLMMLGGMTARWGLHIDANVIADSVIIIYPALMAIMRAITTGPAVVGKQT